MKRNTPLKEIQPLMPMRSYLKLSSGNRKNHPLNSNLKKRITDLKTLNIDTTFPAGQSDASKVLAKKILKRFRRGIETPRTTEINLWTTPTLPG